MTMETTMRSDAGTTDTVTSGTLGARRRLAARLARLLGAFGVGMLLASSLGCAGSYARTAPAAAEAAPVVSVAPAPPPPEAALAGAPSAFESAPTTALPPARERPGLGTEWGETRDSPLRDVAFYRASEAHPFATAEVRYNDEPGVEALADYATQRGARTHEAPAVSGSITVSVHDENGSPLEAVQVGGRWFVIGQEGMRYTIVLQNHTGHRFEAVTTVDGLDVMNGGPGSVHNRGYLLMPYDSVEIDGFRQTHETVAAFRFGRVGDSYAAKTGSARNVGVIGVAFFNEARDPWTPSTDDETRRRVTANPFPAEPSRDDRRYAQPPRW
jgi:hypothetical protein